MQQVNLLLRRTGRICLAKSTKLVNEGCMTVLEHLEFHPSGEQVRIFLLFVL